MKTKGMWVWLVIFLFLGGLVGLAQAKVRGQCSNCHTMHNSQGGSPMTFDNSTTPNRTLLRAANCLGCHSDSAPSGVQAVTPIVKHSSDPGYVFGSTRGSTLAGGDFYYVTLSDAKVHNVDELGNNDDVLNAPPGYVYNGDYGRGNGTWPSGRAVSCAGTYGCHGDPSKEDPFASIAGAHHANINRTGTGNATTVATSYRFLLGIYGTEDPDWEGGTLDTSHHNGYYAVDRSTVNSYTAPDKHTINYLCGECHGNFHAQIDYDSTVGSPWIRHPTDYDMNNVKTKEYGNYPNTALFSGKYGVSAAGDYFVDVPVGNNQGAVKSQVLQASGDAIVLCVSCHKAHGSPYDDLLRWDYSACQAGTGNATSAANCGCFACHTTKY
ncbi:cytochrome c3 family protein [Thermosulfurimonas sp. F29]|uniref:cytochrome c3 family protein n=1 Tax=Thermosulfurimonas sp. F29 TaxID=2867247 RepID=UPI001C82B7CE|nr:cytochrome c3 family protein [Thermosulfurimonas sp. F29]MBX6422067.1 hypothetical protein [Thermosulfurimonas sp. F29]